MYAQIISAKELVDPISSDGLGIPYILMYLKMCHSNRSNLAKCPDSKDEL